MKTHYYYPLAVVLLVLATTSAADEMARMRYATALAFANVDVPDVDGIAAQSVRFSARSRQPGVRPSDIRITLETKDGHQTLPLDSDGNFTLPVSDALRNENPWISANQPKGSMVMSATLSIFLGAIEPVFRDGEWRVGYAKLFPMHGALKRAEATATTIGQEREVTTKLPKPKSVTMYCNDPLAKASIVVGDRRDEVPSPRLGQFVITYSPELIERDAFVVVHPVTGWRFEYQVDTTTTTTRPPK